MDRQRGGPGVLRCRRAPRRAWRLRRPAVALVLAIASLTGMLGGFAPPASAATLTSPAWSASSTTPGATAPPPRPGRARVGPPAGPPRPPLPLPPPPRHPLAPEHGDHDRAGRDRGHPGRRHGDPVLGGRRRQRVAVRHHADLHLHLRV